MFVKRTTKPAAGNKFYITKAKGGYSQCIQGSPTDCGCNVLANCVGYACGRFNEIIGSMKYPTLNCNAENFIERAKSLGLKISDKPVVGGIMVWQKGATLNGCDGAGHVAIVEEVYSDGSILTSESGYGARTAFWTTKRNNSTGRWGQGAQFKFRGCVVNPCVQNTVTSVVTPTQEMIKKYSTCPYAKPTYILTSAKYAKVSNTGVKWLQWHLYKIGLYNGNIDGYFGAKTVESVKLFQKQYYDCNGADLAVDGNVGPLTRESLLAVFNGKTLKKLAGVSSKKVSVSFSNGDKVKLVKGAKYTNGAAIPSWVINTKVLYVRSSPDKSGNVAFSTLKAGAITGNTNIKYLTKI